MHSLSFTNVWNILEKYNFEIDKKLYSDLICTICHDILKNAYQGPCGCRFCYKCISDFLDSNQTLCPGSTETCKGENLNLQQNIHIDNAANRALSRLIVKCPEEYCQFTSELVNIEEHFKSHEIQCPYFEIGCSNPRIISDQISLHLTHESLLHSKLLIDSIQNSKNEMTFLKEDAQNKDLLIGEIEGKINAIIHDSKELPQRVFNIENTLQTYIRENLKLKKDLATALKQITELKSEMKKAKEDIKRMEMQMDEVHISHTEKLRKLTKDNLKNRDEIRNLEIKFTSANMDIQGIRTDYEDNKDCFDNFMCHIDTVNGNITQVREEFDLLKRVFQSCQNEGEDNRNIHKVLDNFKILEEKIFKLEDKVMKMTTTSNEQNICHNDDKINSIEKTVNHLMNVVQKLEDKSDDNEIEETSLSEQDELITADDVESQECSALELFEISLVPFVWKVENFTLKRKQAKAGIILVINSKPFYSHENGYKLCLSIFPDGCGSGKKSHLTVGCCIMKGEHDESLSWPMRHKITISLMDQTFNSALLDFSFSYTTVAHKNRYRFNKPQNSANDGVGATKFIPFNKLISNQRIFKNDSFLLRCIIHL